MVGDDYHRLFLDVNPSKQFWLHNGVAVKNLSELIAVLRDLSDDIFIFHVNEQKNDFAAWVRDVIDEELGQELLKLRDKQDIIHAIEKRMIPSEPKPQIKFPKLKKLEIKEKPVVEEKIDVPSPLTFKHKLDEILEREKEIEARERKRAGK